MKIKIENFGWPIAVVLGVGLFSGFKEGTAKYGIVDVQKTLKDSDMAKKAGETLSASYKQRQDLLEYVNTYPVVTTQQAARFKELTLKPTPTPAETAELTQLKTTFKDLASKLDALQKKANPTPADKQQLDDFGRRSQEISTLVQTWRQDFNNELNTIQDGLQQTNQAAALTSIAEVGKAQGFTLIFVKDVAPYGANDTTADVMKSMNKSK